MSKNKKNYYFSDKEQEAVEEYIDPETSKKRKELIYKNIIHPAFQKMIRMIIFKYNITDTGVDLKSLISETQAHIWEQLNADKYDPEQGKAYSYFTRTVINYLYQKQMKHQRKKEKMGFYSLEDDENYYIETYYEEPEQFSIESFLEWYKKWLDDNIDDFFDNEDESKIALAIYDILQNGDVEIEHRRDFHFAINQMSGINNNYKINKVLNLLKDKYFKIKEEYSKKRELDLE